MDTTQPNNLWSIFASIFVRNSPKLSLANEVFDIIRGRMNGILDDPSKLVEFLCEHLKPKEFEKKKNGEVFTPPSLINEKLDKLEHYCPDIWTNANRTFLDPANGIGNYPALVYQRLMKGLVDAFPNEEERKKHILENMLYMCELNPKNIEESKKLFDPNDKYKLNLFEGSFFDLDVNEEWGIEKFDVIMGNPPYNKDTSKNNAKGQILWPKFVSKSIGMLVDNGYLLFIHPPNWRKPKHELRDVFLNNHVMFLKMFSDRDADKIFSCKVRVDYYLIQKTDVKANTCIVDERGVETTLYLDRTIPYVPNFGISVHTKLHTIDLPTLNCINPRSHDTTRKHVKKNQTVEFKFPLLNTSSSKGRTFYYSSTPHPAQNIKKVMFSNGRYIYPLYDDGVYGGTQSSLYIPVETSDDGLKLIEFINSNLFKFIIKSTKFSNFGTSHELISQIPDLSKDLSLLELTPDEITMIETC